MRAALLSAIAALVLAGTAASCAPRQTRTHFDRWTEDAKKRKDAERTKGTATAKPGATTPSSSGSASPPPPVASNPPAETTTATKSRVIRPEDTEEDDAIY